MIILAPGAERFGEDAQIDELISKYGYTGGESIIHCCTACDDIRQNLSAAAHLIHGSSDGRFRITYCTKYLTHEDVTGVGFGHMPYDEARQRYNPCKMKDGYNVMEDGDVF